MTDTDAVSNGCAVLFLYWLNTELNFIWQQICRAAAPTRAGTYQTLAGKNTAFADFRAVIDITRSPPQKRRSKARDSYPRGCGARTPACRVGTRADAGL
jgi:hypothetical protein